MNVVLIYILVIVGLFVLTGVCTWFFGAALPDKLEDKRDKKFKKLYPNIYKLVDNFTEEVEKLRDEKNVYNHEYHQNRIDIDEINKLLPVIPQESVRYQKNLEAIIELQKRNLELLSKIDDIEAKIKELYPVETQIAHVFYTQYVTKRSCDDIEPIK